jgi:hypothetical protein
MEHIRFVGLDVYKDAGLDRSGGMGALKRWDTPAKSPMNLDASKNLANFREF